MRDLTSPLILIAAGIFWNNSAILASTSGDAQNIGTIGLCISGLLLLIAAVIPWRDMARARDSARGVELMARLSKRENAVPPRPAPSDPF
jgi:hypothetical protein